MTLREALNLAIEHHRAGRLADAEQLYRQILVHQPGNFDAMHLLGVLANQAGRPDLSIHLIRDAIAANPDYPEAHCNLGNALMLTGQVDAAIAAFRQAAVCKPDYAEAHYNLGVASYDKGELDEAIAAFRHAIECKPDYAEAFRNLGAALHDRGSFDDAMAACGRSIALAPGYAGAHHNLAMMLLLRGDFAAGWAEHEWRWRVNDYPTPRWPGPQPQWDGSIASNGTILLHCEQGLGDTIQFSRFVPQLAERCREVIAVCPPQVHRLLRAIPGARWLTTGERAPPCDLHCPLLSLPGVLGATLQTIPSTVPYLHADPHDVERWQKRLGMCADTAIEGGVGEGAPAGTYSRTLAFPNSGTSFPEVGAATGTHTDTPTPPHPVTRRSGASSASPQHLFKVGLAWAGCSTHRKDRNRSIALSVLAPLSAIPCVRFFSLQLGPAAEQVNYPPDGMNLIDWTADLHDIADTAALVANLDLVISVDTAVAHLAGALGKPVWTLLPFVPDWRWLLNRDDSPWYPTMRLFRQQAIGDWATVVLRLAKALAEQIS